MEQKIGGMSLEISPPTDEIRTLRDMPQMDTLENSLEYLLL